MKDRKWRQENGEWRMKAGKWKMECEGCRIEGWEVEGTKWGIEDLG